MGYELWRSRITGYRRKGTRASELKALFEVGITARSIQEPLKSCLYADDAVMVAEELKRLDFDVVGAKRDEGAKVEGFVRGSDLKSGQCAEHVNIISPLDLIAESTPLIKVLDALRSRDHVFVLVGNEVTGIITRADLQKPPVRILLFGLISLFEMHLSFKIKDFYPGDTWRERLSEGRLKKASDLLEQRKAQNEEIDLLACLQLADKKTIMVASADILEHFGLSSKKAAGKILENIAKIRDKLAHSQDLATGSTWEDIIEVSTAVQDMLDRSDRLIEQAAICLANGEE